MPCESDHMEADSEEVYLSQVLCHHLELDGKKYSADWFRGYHPRVDAYVSKKKADKLVVDLCSRLQAIDVTKYSLELQMWWRDHQAMDAEREKEEKEATELKEKQRAALSKLTPEDIEVLGLKKRISPNFSQP